MPIPRLIFQTWKNHTVPDKWKSCRQSLEKFHTLIDLTGSPDNFDPSNHLKNAKNGEYVYVLLDDTEIVDFVKEYFPQYLDMFKKFKHPIQRADMIRYMWLYRYGGIYMDLDYELLKPFDNLVKYETPMCLIQSTNPGRSITNSFMMSQPGNPFWIEVLEEIVRRQKHGREWYAYGKHLEVMLTTGPGLVQIVLNKTRTPYLIFPPALVNKLGVKDFKHMPDQENVDTHLYPLEGCSWGGWDTKTYNWVYQNWEVLLFVLIAIILLLIGWWLYRKYNPKDVLVTKENLLLACENIDVNDDKPIKITPKPSLGDD